MKNFLLITLIFTNYFIFAQNYSFTDNISWQDNYELSINNTKISTLNFQNAFFDDNFTPIFNKSINISDYGINQTNIDVEITDIKYETISNCPSKLKNNSNILDKINFNYSVFKGRNNYFLEYNFYPFIKKNGQIFKVTSFKVTILSKNSTKQNYEPKNYATNSILNSGTWVKIGIPQSGVYKLTFDELKSLGFSSPEQVRIFGNDAGVLSFWNYDQVPDDLTENYIYKGSDYILFYADGASRWKYNSSNSYFYRNTNIYSDTAYYFLTDYNTGFSNSIPDYNQPSNPTKTITSFDFYDIFEKNDINLIRSGRIWLSNPFLYNPQQTIPFTVPNIISGEQGKIIMTLAVRTPQTASINTVIEDINRTDVFSPHFGETYNTYVDYQKMIFNFTQNSSSPTLNLTFNKPTSSANAWIDYITINTKCNLAYQNQLIFSSTENIGTGKISEFKISSADNNIKVWDISSPTLPLNIKCLLSGNYANFTTATDTIKRFITFKETECLTPVTTGANVGTIANQNLHNVPVNTDMIIIAAPIFVSQANEIAQIHKSHDNLNCIVVTTDQIYNEFSSGMKNVPAIRNYIRMVYEKTNFNLKYVLLFGDGSYNNIGATTASNPNYIPTFQTYDSFNIQELSTVSDDFYTFLDENEGELTGASDVAIGRFPVKSTDEADIMVAKLKTYYDPQNYGDWHNIITMATDDRDKSGDTFTNDAESLADKIDTIIPFMNIKKIYLDGYQQQTSANGEEYPDAIVEFNNRLNNGTLIVNYLGHGSEHALTSEGLVTTTSISSWTNSDKLPLFITGTCEFSRYDNASADLSAQITSAGEMIILQPNGGSIALLTTARVSYSGTNTYINNKFYSFLFSKHNGVNCSIGDAYMLAKNQMTSFHKFLFVLLGDPAVRLQYATNRIVPSTINGQDITTFQDSIQALDTVTIEGYLTDDANNKLTDFNGTITLSYFDKKRFSQTLNNDGNGAMNYWSQYNKLFRGRAAVTNGNFKISFIIPKDIYYNYGKSKFSFYAQSDDKQATGQNKDVILGGINPNAPTDNTPPKIRLFINDSSFVNGGITDPNPSIYAILSDDNGINTSSASIGHDISVTLDNNPNKTYSLNEYYQSDINNFKQGTVSFQLFKLPEGTHSAKLKAWDIQNNSNEKNIEFVVVKNNELTISHLLNYPNPFTTNTNFYFEHNKPGVNLDILLQITTVSGKVVKTIHTQMITDGYRSSPINWNGTDDFGKPIARGVYIYSLKIRTPNGKTVQQYEKLLILK